MFRDFCLELEKKEKDDRRKQRDGFMLDLLERSSGAV
jgi:hypothetical protein